MSSPSVTADTSDNTGADAAYDSPKSAIEAAAERATAAAREDDEDDEDPYDEPIPPNQRREVADLDGTYVTLT